MDIYVQERQYGTLAVAPAQLTTVPLLTVAKRLARRTRRLTDTGK